MEGSDRQLFEIKTLCNMADRLLVVNGPLCYLLSHFNKTDQRQLKTTLLNFFQPDVIADAKDLFFHHVSKLSCSDSHLKYTKRRDSNGRAAKELNDIFTALSILDENKLLLQLPLFVTDDPSNLPSANIGEGDMKAIMIRFEKMELLISHLQNCMNQSVAAIKPPPSHHSVPVYNTSVRLTNQSLPSVQPCVQTVNKSLVRDSERSLTSGVPSVNTTWGARCMSTGSASVSCEEGASWKFQRNKRRRTKTNQQGDSQHDQRLASSNSAATCDDLLRSNQHRELNDLPKQSGTGSQQQSYATAASKVGHIQRKPVAPMLVGKNKTLSTLGRSRVTAAKPYIGKAVFCVDNVALSVSVDDIVEFVLSLGVTVLSCFLVKPRRTRWQQEKDIFPVRNTFRLCVPREEIDKLLIADAWPDHVAITEWRFLKKVNGSFEKERRGVFPLTTSDVFDDQPLQSSNLASESVSTEVSRGTSITASSIGPSTLSLSIPPCFGAASAAVSSCATSPLPCTSRGINEDNSTSMDTTIIEYHQNG